jgi:hypothetical protein
MAAGAAILLNLTSIHAAEASKQVLSSNWKTGEALRDPWQSHAGLEHLRVFVDSKNPSPFGGESTSVVLEDANSGGGGASIGGTLAQPQTGSLRVSFDFKLPQKASNQPTFMLIDSQGKPGLFLILDNNSFPQSIPGNNITNRSSASERQLITPLRHGEWYQAELLIWPAEVGRYTITVSQYGGEPTRSVGLSFREKLKDFSAIRFASNTDRGIGTLVLANVTVEADIDLGEAGELRSEDGATQAQGPTLLRVDPNAQPGGDGSAERPLLSPEAAQMKIREMRRDGTYPSAGVTVELAGGIYYRTKTWQLTKEDSGLWNAPVVYRAEPKARVVFHGGRSLPLSDFQPVRDQATLERLPESSRSNVVELDLTAAGIDSFGELPLYGHSMHALQQMTKWRRGGKRLELFFNGQPMTLARWPNKDFTRVGRIVEKGDHIRKWMEDVKGQKDYVPENERNDPPVGFAFQLEDKERLKRWSRENDLRLYGYWFNNYSDQAVEVAEVDPESGVIRSRQPSAYSIKKNQRFFAYNALSELDAPGEWYLDRESGKLYIYPNVRSNNARIDLSLLDQPLLQLNQTSHVHFEGLTFLATRSHGVMVRDGESIVMDRCRIGNVGGSGVQMFGRHNRFLNGEILQTGGSGITLGGGDTDLLAPAHNEVFNSHIHHFARILKTYQPGVRLRGVGNRVTHCEINAAPHVAILIGGNEHRIERNYIHDVCRETDDMGAIYGGRSWISLGTVIQHNLFHNITGYSSGTHRVSGIYLDDGLSGTSIIENIFINLAQGIFFNGGRENRAESNLFLNVGNMMRATDMTRAYETWAVGSYGTLEKSLQSSPYQTPVWKAHYPRLSGIVNDNPEKPKYSVIKNNLRYDSPMVIGPSGIHESFVDVGWVDNNPETNQLPGRYDTALGTFVPNPSSGLFDTIPELKHVPFSFIGRLK